jgi:predicted enzyme related to lactoylglutathione lyase
MSPNDDLGKFIWHDLMTTEPEAAAAFYSRLFPEWTIEKKEAGGHPYRMVSVGGRLIACMIPFEKSHGFPSHWVGYVGVENCDKAVARMVELGGKCCYPGFTAPGVGRFALVSDPQGAFIKPFQPEKPMPVPAVAQIGEVCWNELLTTNIEQARTFYAGVFGWEIREHDMGPMGKYTLFYKGETGVGGGMPMTPEMRGSPNWMYYFLVEDVDARTRKAGEVGGQIHVQPRDIPGVGRFSVVADPGGGVFSLFKSAQM